MNKKYHNPGKPFFFIPLLILFIIGFLASCDDDESNRLGLGILPASDTLDISGFDSLSILAYTEKSPPIKTSQLQYSPFGYYNDPIFGSTGAEFASEFGYSSSDTIDGENLVADSAILFLRVFEDQVYGDADALIKMNAYLMNSEFPDDSLQYSDYDSDNFTDLIKIGSNNIQFNEPQIKYYFDPAFADMLVQPAREENDTTYDGIEGFKERFKGLLFRTEPTDANGAIALLNFYSYTSAQEGRVVPSFIQLYYHHTVGDSIVNKQFTYTFERNVDMHFNMYNHYYEKSDVKKNLEPNYIDSVVYLQGLAGTRIKLSVPGLENWISSPGEVAVNSAVLNIKLEDFDKTSDFLTPPFQLGIKVHHSDGEEELIEDLQTGSLNYFRGNLSGRSYTFNVTKHVQSVIDGAENTDLYIYPLNYLNGEVNIADNYILPERAVLSGSTNSTPIKLSIIYTKL